MRLKVLLGMLVTLAAITSNVSFAEPEILSDSQRLNRRVEEYRAELKRKREQEMNSLKTNAEVKLGDLGNTTLRAKKYDERTDEIVLQTNRWYGTRYLGGTYYNYQGRPLSTVPERTVKEGYYELRLRPDGRGGYNGRLVGKNGEVKETYTGIDRNLLVDPFRDHRNLDNE